MDNETIGLHIRQGDYLGNSLYLELQSDYYLAALNYVMNHKDAKHIHIYSDSSLKDNQIVKDIEDEYPHLSLSFHISQGGRDMYDLLEMSRHRVFICANSTFSWWAAALDETEEKIVIRPERYFSKKPTPRFLYPSSWISF